ncbi:MAG: 23S rRNA (adenine(2503)-C(2))-methyltransferase RlmN [Malacoplasma sp.]
MKSQKNNKSIYSVPSEKMKSILDEKKIKKYITDQIFDWLYVKKVTSIEDMTNISIQNKEILHSLFEVDTLKIVETQSDESDNTVKFLFELCDGNKIETVLMQFSYGYSVCVSTQVGCNMGCTFCASGIIKKVRDLNINEMVLQVLIAKKYLWENRKENLLNIVVMGIGEPFDNFNNLLDFLNIVRDQKGLNFSSRKITVSTCGLVNKIREWAELEKQVNLAISLHASNDEIRTQLMPINHAFNIKKLVASIDDYIAKTNRRVTIEYILIDKVNDRREHALELVELFSNKLVYINLIPYNKVKENKYVKSTNCRDFYETLRAYGLTCTIRQERGNSIDAACGQLRNKNL